jgi:hypothetical protein
VGGSCVDSRIGSIGSITMAGSPPLAEARMPREVQEPDSNNVLCCVVFVFDSACDTFSFVNDAYTRGSSLRRGGPAPSQKAGMRSDQAALVRSAYSPRIR